MKAYPLQWPKGWPKTEPMRRERPQFKQTLPSALNFLKKQVTLMGGKGLVLSSNYTLGDESPKESGVCAYFLLREQNIAIPCDRWIRVEHNVHAIALTLEAMRGMERWGAKHMITAMFSGFKTLPDKASGLDYYALLGLERGKELTEDEITAAFRAKSKTYHPDIPGTGSVEKWRDLREAHDMLMQTVKKS